MEMAVKAIDVPSFRKRQKDARAAGRHLGIGFSTFCERTGYGSPAFAARGMEITPGWETVIVTVDPSGFVEARIGSSPHGQGLRTTLAQIIADELGLAPEMIRVVHGDTDRTPYGGAPSPPVARHFGRSHLIAARKVRVTLLKIASHLLEAAPDDILLAMEWQRSLAPTGRIPIAMLHAKPICKRTVSKARLSRAFRNRALRSRRHIFQCLPRRYRRGGRGDRHMSGLRNFWWLRTPAASSIQ
jgi:CO/xanthine dehydrogenase Mo-binding subunit